jgi:hypothetical protein
MRLIREIPSRDFRITLFAWNNRYLIKLEQGLLEQTYKIDQFDVENEEQVIKLIDAEFIEQAEKRFRDMSQSLLQARMRLN